VIIGMGTAAGAPGIVIGDIQNFEGGRITTTYAVLDKSAILSFRLCQPDDGAGLDEDAATVPTGRF